MHVLVFPVVRGQVLLWENLFQLRRLLLPIEEDEREIRRVRTSYLGCFKVPYTLGRGTAEYALRLTTPPRPPHYAGL